MPVLHTAIISEPLSAERLTSLVTSASRGAVVSFVGLIRDHDPEATSTVTGLSYSAHPQAAEFLARVTAEVVTELGDGVAVAVEHRIGELQVGEAAIVAVAAGAHRREAFEACETLVNRIKAEVPIWKHQHEASGRSVWSNLGLPQ